MKTVSNGQLKSRAGGDTAVPCHFEFIPVGVDLLRCGLARFVQPSGQDNQDDPDRYGGQAK